MREENNTTDLRKAAEMALETLELLDKRGGLGLDVHEYLGTKIDALRQALAQPEQEPVMFMSGRYVAHPVQHEEYQIPLYTAPPMREWVGLTDEEISEVLGSDIHLESSGELRFIRSIEAKLKEKNGYANKKSVFGIRGGLAHDVMEKNT